MWSLCLGRKPRTLSHSVLSFQACYFCLSLVLFLTLSRSLTLTHTATHSKDENLIFICWPSTRLDKANGTSAPQCLCSFHFIKLSLACSHMIFPGTSWILLLLNWVLFTLIEFLFVQTTLSWLMSLPVLQNLLGNRTHGKSICVCQCLSFSLS